MVELVRRLLLFPFMIIILLLRDFLAGRCRH
jgi:hypothetical protein